MQSFRLIGLEVGMEVGRVDPVTPDHGAELSDPCFNQTARPVSRGCWAQARTANSVLSECVCCVAGTHLSGIEESYLLPVVEVAQGVSFGVSKLRGISQGFRGLSIVSGI